MKIKQDQDQSLISFLIEQLDRLPEIRARRMFGGHGLYSGELFFAIVDDGQVYFKTDDVTKARYEALGLPPFRPSETHNALKYHLVPVDMIEDAELLTEWAREALEVSRCAAEAKATKKKRNKSG